MFQKLKQALGLDPIKNQSDAYTRRVADINKLEAEVTAATNDIASKEIIFKNSVQAVINTLNADKNNVKYLKELLPYQP